MPLTEDGRQIDQIVLDSFVMTQPVVGQTVLFYPTGKAGRDIAVARVMRVAPRTIELQTANGYMYTHARHVDDPKLLLSADQREYGAWNFTEEYLEQQRWRKSVDEQLEQIQESLEPIVLAHQDEEDRRGERKPTGFKLMKILKEKAAGYGLVFPDDVKMAELSVLIERYELAKNPPVPTAENATDAQPASA